MTASAPVEAVRALIAIGVTERFFAAGADERQAVFEATRSAFDGYAERFGVTVLGTFYDDTLQIGPSTSFPWTCYLLLDAPDYPTVRAIANLVRETEVGEHRLWRYYKVEARLGRPLFFGEG